MLDITHHYQTDLVSVKPVPLRGHYLRRSLRGRHAAAFAAADLYRGVTQLVAPTLTQCADVTGTDISSVWWALRRATFRKEIVAGEMPLVPARPKKPQPLPLPAPQVDDATIISFVRRVGIGRVLDAAVAVEAAE